MGKTVFIAEKPSVAREFAKALKLQTKSRDGFLEGNNTIITWCVGHLVTMSYPEKYDESLKKWSLSALPFLPEEFLYEVIPGVKKQFRIVRDILRDKEVTTIYVCTDSGREGEYIYRLVEQQAQISFKEKERKRVWIDSQTEDEIIRGIKEAKDLSAYDDLSASAYLRAKEDYLMGINFSRLLTLKYGSSITAFLKNKYTVISVGRVMTCVLGMVVQREREIRDFVKTPFYRVLGTFVLEESEVNGEEALSFTGEWKAVEGSPYFASPLLYKENGFKEKADAEKLVKEDLGDVKKGILSGIEKKKEKKQAPLLYNLAELQNDCARRFKISPDETLRIVQELYEKKLITYPRTDARVLSTAVAKEIGNNLNGLMKYEKVGEYLKEIIEFGSHKTLAKTRYVNDKQITDHYAIIPTGQGFTALKGVAPLGQQVYDIIVRRFLSIFYPPAVYQKVALTVDVKKEKFFGNFKMLAEEGYLKVLGVTGRNTLDGQEHKEKESGPDTAGDMALFTAVQGLKKGCELPIGNMEIKEGETTPPKRYNSGSLILAMENAGQLIEDEELRAQIKGSGIGTSATRAEIQKKLVHIKYLNLNGKTQIITPTLLGEMIYDVVKHSITSLLNPQLTASWEKGLSYVAKGEISSAEYMKKLNDFVGDRTNKVKALNNQGQLQSCYQQVAKHYKTKK